MPTGRVKWFNNAKGYGFILPGTQSEGEDLFVHYSSIAMEGYRTLKAGQCVTYEIVQGPKGLQAINVSAVSESTTQCEQVEAAIGQILASAQPESLPET